MTGGTLPQRLSAILKSDDGDFLRVFAGARFNRLMEVDAEGVIVAARMSGRLTGRPAAMASRTASSVYAHVWQEAPRALRRRE
jgi:hypothetical protein